MTEIMVTTKDNPFSYFTEFEEWNAFDIRNGYNTLALLAQVTHSSPEISEADQALALDLAVQEILEFNVTGMYVLVKSDE